MNKYQIVLDKFINDGHRLTHRERHEFGAILQELVDKENKYQAIEEELGISLPILFKALKNGVCIQEEGCFECTAIYFHLLERKFVIGCANKENMGYELLKDYGKTWWLKEDLKSE